MEEGRKRKKKRKGKEERREKEGKENPGTPRRKVKRGDEWVAGSGA